MGIALLTLTSQEQKLLEKLGVILLVLFGSRAQNSTHTESDYDFGVLPQHPPQSFSEKDIYDGLYDLLSAKINQLVDIDIVVLRDAPMELQYHVSKYGVVLYEKSPQVFAEFREQVMNKYADFAPLRSIFQNATLSRI